MDSAIWSLLVTLTGLLGWNEKVGVKGWLLWLQGATGKEELEATSKLNSSEKFVYNQRKWAKPEGGSRWRKIFFITVD